MTAWMRARCEDREVWYAVSERGELAGMFLRAPDDGAWTFVCREGQVRVSLHHLELVDDVRQEATRLLAEFGRGGQ